MIIATTMLLMDPPQPILPSIPMPFDTPSIDTTKAVLRKVRTALGLGAGLAVAVAAAVGGAMLLGETSAHADPSPFTGTEGDHNGYAFWIDAMSVGVPGNATQDATLGNVLCATMRSGGASEAGNISVGAIKGLTIPEATYVVHAAEFHFCPDQYGQSA